MCVAVISPAAQSPPADAQLVHGAGFPVPATDIGRHQMYEMMSHEDQCTAACMNANGQAVSSCQMSQFGGSAACTCGSYQISPMEPGASNHSQLDFELYLGFRSVTTILAGIAAAVCLKGVHAEGKSDYLKPLVRALIVLVVVEVLFNIVHWFGFYGMCNDTTLQTEMTNRYHCVPHTADSRSSMMSFSSASTPLECEERMAKFDLPSTLVGVAINTYFLWIVASFEKSTREAGAQELAAPSQPV